MIAIVITVMVLDVKVPRGDVLDFLSPVWVVFLSYVLSLIYVGIYWNNHHHMLQAAPRVGGGPLWANLHLLFWLSLMPFTTSWMGDNNFAQLPVAVYGFGLLMNGVAYGILAHVLMRSHGRDANAAARIGKDLKGNISVAMYLAAIGLSFVNTTAALAIYVAVAAILFIPDRRFAR